MPRFVLLEHTGHPDDPTGRHFDLLLEEPETCQTWRLAEIPLADGEPVAAAPLPPHRLAWLDIEASEVSGGRGFARQVDSGSYQPTARPDAFDLVGSLLAGRLDLVQQGTRYTAHLTPTP